MLEELGYITHTLTISTATSDRDENPKISLRQKPALGERGGYGLDSLDKALVVFLLPEDNPFYTGIHRRVDLIIAPWRAWGTAIVGWTVKYSFNHANIRVAPLSSGICVFGQRSERTSNSTLAESQTV